MNVEVFCFDAVAPVRERGLKRLERTKDKINPLVAPVRERGLKISLVRYDIQVQSRSREGAWIEKRRNGDRHR